MSPRLLPLVAALVAIAVSAPLLRVYFTADDFEHLYQFANYGPTLTVLAAPHDGHMYLVRNPIFACNYALFGMHAAWYFATAVAMHAANVLLQNTVDGRRVYFVSSDPALLAQREAGGRLSSLLLPSGACPPRSS